MKPPASTTDRQLDRDARELYASVRKLIRIYQLRDRQATCYRDISASQCHALEALVAHGAMGVNPLSDLLRLEKSTTSRMIRSLEEKGYVISRVDPGDGRARIVEMTRRGRRLHDDIVDELVAEKRELLRGIDDDIRSAAIRVVDGMARMADARFGAETTCTETAAGKEQP